MIANFCDNPITANTTCQHIGRAVLITPLTKKTLVTISTGTQTVINSNLMASTHVEMGLRSGYVHVKLKTNG